MQQNPKQKWRALEHLFDIVAVVDSSRKVYYGNERFRALAQGQSGLSDLATVLDLPQECWEDLVSVARPGQKLPIRSVPFSFKGGAKGFAQVCFDPMPAEIAGAENIFLCVLKEITPEMESKTQADENARLIDELRRNHAEAHFLWRLATETTNHSDPKAVLEMVVKRLREDLGFEDACFLYMPEGSERFPEAVLAEQRVGSRLREVSHILAPSLKQKHFRIDISSVKVDPYGLFWLACFRPKSGRPMFLLARSTAALGDANRRGFLESLAMQLTSWLDSRGSYVESMTDSLTGLANRRHFDSRFAIECLLARNRGMILSLILIDIDYFKKINDQHGHPAGDTVLRTVGTILKASVRTTDIPARVGGEEFAIVLLDTSPADAINVAEKIRTRVEGTMVKLPEGGEIKVTVSCGIAGFATAQDTAESVYSTADRALYQAKNAGRNQIIVIEKNEAP